MTEPELSVVVPVWSGPDDIGRHDLGRLLPALAASLGTIGVEAEVLVAAGSRPSSLREVVEAQGAKFVVRDNGGYGDILRAGLVEAKGSWVVTMDADSPHTADFVQTMWANRSTAEVLIGSRYVRGSVAQMPLGRRYLSRLLNALYRGGLSLPFRDLSSGFRMYRQEVLADVAPLDAHGLDILPEIIAKATSQGWKVVEVPFWYRGSSPWTRARMIRFGVGYASTLGRLFGLRNSVRAADYDHRAFDSWIPLQRYWQRKRFEIIRDFVAPLAGGPDPGHRLRFQSYRPDAARRGRDGPRPAQTPVVAGAGPVPPPGRHEPAAVS